MFSKSKLRQSDSLNMVNFLLEVTLNEDDLKCLKMSIVIRLNILNMMAFFLIKTYTQPSD